MSQPVVLGLPWLQPFCKTGCYHHKYIDLARAGLILIAQDYSVPCVERSLYGT